MNIHDATEAAYKRGYDARDREIVRCGECKHWGKHDVYVPGETDSIKACEWAFWMIGENGYCVYGERKSNDDRQG